MLSRRHASDGWTPRHTHTHTHTQTHARLHPPTDTCINTYICICVHPFIHTDTSNAPDGASSQGETINQPQVCLSLIHMLCYYGALDQPWESIKYITHMQILSDGMTGRPSQSFRYVCGSLVWKLCDYSGPCAMEGQRDSSFDMRYVLMRRQWVLTARAIMCIVRNMCVKYVAVISVWACASIV